ncbi:MAG: hypothetical protein DMG74_18345 [Acidobacteria bacterium]|nr:MAG: hypothetical protein DMG74_18345 [Acidobacteriota bacterium]
MKKTELIGDFLNDVREQRLFREQKAAEWPDDDRNARCAEGLAELHTWVSERPANDPLIVRLDHALEALYADDVDSGGFVPMVTDRLARFRFHNGPPESCEDFIVRLTEAIEAYVKSEKEEEE